MRIINNIYSITFIRYLIKTSEKLSTECYYVFLKTFHKKFHKIVAVRHSKWKVLLKQTFHLTSTIYLLLRCSTEKQTQLTHPVFLTFFSNFLSFNSRISSFSCFVFRLTTEAVARSVLWKKTFLEISQNSQENTCARVSFLLKLPEALYFLGKPFLQNTSRRLLL